LVISIRFVLQCVETRQW